jgi:hypothetical protein
MPKKRPTDTTTATAVDIERSIQALNKMAELLWGDGRETEAKALLDALNTLNLTLDRIRISESRKSEPLDKETPKETSKLISDMIDFLEAKVKFSKDEISRLIPLPAGRLAEMSAKPESYFLPNEEIPNNVISFQLRK